jgi:CheY-like chemotaxis protein
LLKQKPFVLVVDDDNDLRPTVSELLQEEGYETAEASNGREALALLRSGTLPAVVLLDIMMPGLDGMDVLREMRADPVLRHVPVLVLSASMVKEAPSNTRFLQKPFLADDLFSHVKSLISRSSQ